MEEREAKERHYLERLSQDYVAPLGHVADLLEGYTAGVAGYADVLERYATFCAAPGLTDTSSQAFVATLTPSLEALDGKARALVTEASEGASVGVSSK